jgi:1-acyl-sn-glycerol-3-phosphate acyltransferase
MSGLGVLRYRITGNEIVDTAQGCLIVANHPSLIDVVFLLAMFRNADCVVKSAIWSNPITMIAMRTIDYVPNKDPEFVIEECIKRLKAGHNLILFPEGTRSIPGKALDFKRGAATIAIRAGSPCLPVSIKCAPTTLTKGEPWYSIPRRRVLFQLDVLESIEVRSFIDDSPNEKKASLALNDFLRLALSRNLRNESQSR